MGREAPPPRLFLTPAFNYTPFGGRALLLLDWLKGRVTSELPLPPPTLPDLSGAEAAAACRTGVYALPRSRSSCGSDRRAGVSGKNDGTGSVLVMHVRRQSSACARLHEFVVIEDNICLCIHA